MSQQTKNQIVLETLAQINASLKSDSNACVSTRGGWVAPEQAYIELVREVLELAK